MVVEAKCCLHFLRLAKAMLAFHSTRAQVETSNPPSLIKMIKTISYMRWKSLKFTSVSVILTKRHKYLMVIGETLLPEKRISSKPLPVLRFLFIASFNLFKILQGLFENEYWLMLTFPTGKYSLILYYPRRTFHFPRATGKRNSRPLHLQRGSIAHGIFCDILELVFLLNML